MDVIRNRTNNPPVSRDIGFIIDIMIDFQGISCQIWETSVLLSWFMSFNVWSTGTWQQMCPPVGDSSQSHLIHFDPCQKGPTVSESAQLSWFDLWFFCHKIRGIWISSYWTWRVALQWNFVGSFETVAWCTPLCSSTRLQILPSDQRRSCPSKTPWRPSAISSMPKKRSQTSLLKSCNSFKVQRVRTKKNNQS